MFYKSLLLLAFLLILTSAYVSASDSTASNFMDEYKAYSNAIGSGESDLELGKSAEKLAKHSATKYGETHENTINLTISAANHYRDAEEYENAASLYDTALGLYEKANQKGSEGHILLLTELLKTKKVVSFKDTKKVTQDLVEGLTEYFENTDIQESLPNALVMYETIVLDGVSYSGSRKVKNLGNKIVEAAEQHLSKDDIRLTRVQFTHAKLLKGIGKKNDAIKYFIKVIDTTEGTVDYSHPYALGAHAQLVGLYESKRDSESATEHCIAIGRMRPWLDDIEPVPLFREDPRYPNSYARDNKEGWAELMFDITPFGFVENVKVVRTEGGKKFGEESLKALENWRYAPKFEAGVASYAKGLKVRIDYILGTSKGSKLNNI